MHGFLKNPCFFVIIEGVDENKGEVIMWAVSGYSLKMVEGDFGIQLPITIEGTTLTAEDCIKIEIKDKRNGETVLVKDFTNIEDNTFSLELTESESELLAAGFYVYNLDWYQSGEFLGNIITGATFKVVDKA